MGYVVGVVGATGVVGKEIISVLEERQFPVAKLIPIASERSAGSTVTFQGNEVAVVPIAPDVFDGIDYALFSAGAAVSKQYAPIAAQKGAVAIDNTSYFRMHDGVPLVVPEVNLDAIPNPYPSGIIANPNCSTAQMVLVLAPIHQKYHIERVVVSTYQSVSGAGKKALDALENQSRASLAGGSYTQDVFPKPIAFNVIPQIDVFLDNGYTKEEMKMMEETQKILNLPSLSITATAVRVPVFIGHSESINIQTRLPLDPADVAALLSKAPGVQVVQTRTDYPTPRDVAGQDDVYVGRIRKDLSVENGIELWCVGDNLRKGAALNAVQIAEALVKRRQ